MFTPEQQAALAALIAEQPVAALGTLHKGEAFVSMVPVVLVHQPLAFVVHVSGLATHTQDMLRHPAVSLMLTAMRHPGGPVHALARATFQCQAETLIPASARHAAARQAYLQRFPDTEPLFEFGDFVLVQLVPRWMRWVGGFGQATSVMAEELTRLFDAEPGG